MPLALGLILVLPMVGALHRSNEIFVLPKNGTIATGYEKYSKQERSRAFSVTKILPEGEIQRVTRWKGICTKETIVDWGHTNVALREVLLTDSKRKLQLIYEGERLTDCVEDSLTDHDSSRCSLHQQQKEKSPNAELRIEMFEGDEIYQNFPILHWLGSTRQLHQRCNDVRTRTRQQLMLHQKHRRIGRSLQRMVIAPGTKWCGPHRTANTYKELGALDHTDRCCRRHDHCYRAIPPFSERYNLWNYMPFTLSHCGCDQSFRTCLKMAGTSSANFIGRIFFNVVQTKCFVLKPHKVCTRQSWWGKCEKHEYKKQAHLRNNVPY